MKDLEIYFIHRLKVDYQSALDLFDRLKTSMTDEAEQRNDLGEFVTRLHAKETIDGQIRAIVYDMIFTIEAPSVSPIVYRTLTSHIASTHRTSKAISFIDCIVHCRCGSMYDETTLVQCYACQVRLPTGLRCLDQYLELSFI